MGKLSELGRLELVREVEATGNISRAARNAGISRQRATEWYRRYQDGGEEALMDRSSAPHQTPAKLDQQITRRTIQLAIRYPEKGVGWYLRKLPQGVSRASVYNILKKAQLGSRRDRFERILKSWYYDK